MWGRKLYWVISFVSNVKGNDAKRKEYKWTIGYPLSLLSPLTLPCLVTICLGVLSIVLGVCLKWAILPPVVDSMVMSQLRWQNIVNISRNFVDSSSYSGWRRATRTRGRPGWRRPSLHTWSSTSSRYRSSPHPCPWCYITKIEFAKLFHRRVASWWSKEFSIKILFLWLRHNGEWQFAFPYNNFKFRIYLFRMPKLWGRALRSLTLRRLGLGHTER